MARQGNTLTFGPFKLGVVYTGTLNADGSFSTSSSWGGSSMGGVFATEGGRTMIRDGTYDIEPTTENRGGCRLTFEARKQ